MAQCIEGFTNSRAAVVTSASLLVETSKGKHLNGCKAAVTSAALLAATSKGKHLKFQL